MVTPDVRTSSAVLCCLKLPLLPQAASATSSSPLLPQAASAASSCLLYYSSICWRGSRHRPARAMDSEDVKRVIERGFRATAAAAAAAAAAEVLPEAPAPPPGAVAAAVAVDVTHVALKLPDVQRLPPPPLLCRRRRSCDVCRRRELSTLLLRPLRRRLPPPPLLSRRRRSFNVCRRERAPGPSRGS